MTTSLKPINAAADAVFAPPADGWIHVSPFGRYPVTMADGTDAEIIIDRDSCAAQVAAFDAEAKAAGDAWGGMLVDFDHFSLDVGCSSKAAGWADAIAARDDGLWARVRWSDAGLSAIRGGDYRYTSPVHLPRDCRRQGAAYIPSRLHRLALTNDPRMLQGAARMRPISSRTTLDSPIRDDSVVADTTNNPPAPGGKKGPRSMDYKAMLLGFLGLPAEATDDEITAALEAKQKADSAAAASATEMIASRDALRSRAESAETELAGFRADRDIATLEAEGYAIKSRDQVRAAIIAGRDTFLAGIRAMKPTAKADEPLRSRKDAGTPGAGGSTPATRDEAVAAEQTKHNFRRRADAVASAQRTYPALWKD